MSSTDIAYQVLAKRTELTSLKLRCVSAYAMYGISLRDVRYQPTRCPVSAYAMSGTQVAQEASCTRIAYEVVSITSACRRSKDLLSCTTSLEGLLEVSSYALCYAMSGTDIS
eukprot:3769153-Rhodomonas_salina.6